MFNPPKLLVLFSMFILLFIFQSSFDTEKAEACCGISGMTVDAQPPVICLRQSTTISGYINLLSSATRPYLTWRLTIAGPASATYTQSGNQTVLVTYTPPAAGEYTYTLYARETRYGTSSTITKKFTVVEVFSITSPNEGDVFCPYQNITFTAVTNPAGYESLIQWSGGENPATGTGASFTTSFSTSGAKTVTASCGGSSVSRTIIILSIDSGTATVVSTDEMFIVSSTPFPTEPIVQQLQDQIEEVAPFIVTDESGFQRVLSAAARRAGVSAYALSLGHKIVSLNNRIVKAAIRDEEIHLPASEFAFIEPLLQYQAQAGSHCGSFRSPTPCPPWMESGVYFPTRDEAVQHLVSLGYHQTANYAGGTSGNDYTIVVPHPACGTGPFRTQAIIRQQGDCWTYSTQGPEPNPEFRSYTTRPHAWWVGYVAWWHRFYC